MRKKKTNVQKILEEYGKEGHTPECYASMQGWLVSDWRKEEKDAELRKIFAEMGNEYTLEDYGALEKMWEKFDFPPEYRQSFEQIARERLLALDKEYIPAIHETERRSDTGDYPAAGRNTGNGAGNRPVRRLWWGPATRIAAAAAVALVVSAGAAWLSLSSLGSVEAPHVAMVAMELPDTAGAQNRTDLDDGSHLLVRRGSKILRAEDFGENRLIAMSGEAYFDVAKDSLHRFTVQTPHLNVNVLGTQFNVEADEDSPYTVVALYQGRIVVDGMKCAGKEPVELAPGQRMVYENATCEYRIEPVDGNVPDWIAGRLSFDNTHYEDVFRIYEWYYGVKIEVEGQLAHESFRYKLLGDEPISRAMSILKDMKDNFTYTIEGDTVKITAKK